MSGDAVVHVDGDGPAVARATADGVKDQPLSDLSHEEFTALFDGLAEPELPRRIAYLVTRREDLDPIAGSYEFFQHTDVTCEDIFRFLLDQGHDRADLEAALDRATSS